MFENETMTNRVLLNNIDHADVAVAMRHGAEFGDRVSAVRIFPTEYVDAAREYPILFRQDAEGGALLAVALLGFDAGENLFLHADEWRARYVPAVQARGPFSIGLRRGDDDAPGEPMIHVDLDDPRVGAAEGRRLFLDQGGDAPLLGAAAAVLRRIATGLEVEPAMFAAFADFNLLAARRLKVEVGAARRYDLADFLTIDPERLAALDGPALERLHRAGFLELAFAAARSLGNIGHLIDLKRAAHVDA